MIRPYQTPIDTVVFIAPLVAAGLIAAAGSAAGTGIQAASQSASNRKQWRYQKKAMELQQQYALAQMREQAALNTQMNKDFFDYQNAYNEPSKIFERYLKAGINPSAVLGSAGVGISSTVSGGAQGVSTPSGPTASAEWNPTDFSGFSQAGSQALEGLVAQSQVDLNRSAAEKNKADAQSISSRTQSPEYYAQIANLDKQALEVGIKDATVLTKLHAAQADIESSRAAFSDLVATYELQDLMSHYANTVELNRRLRAQNDIEIPLLGQMIAADLSLTLAQAEAARANASLASVDKDIAGVTLKDVQNWFSVNWETPIKVPQVNEHGKPTGKMVEMTGKEIKEYLTGLSATEGTQSYLGNWYGIRSEKNAFGYQMANTVVRAAAAGAVAAVVKSPSVPLGYEQTTTRYDSKGDYVGGTSVSRRWLQSHR
ncbi:MAG: DNA pilot protein [Chaetfec virus UA24_2231]|nr:MAG: DNA pilot protein [Chaetfec virus UA24_2231]